MATNAAWQEPRSPQVEIPATSSPYKNGSRTRSRSRDARSRSPHRRVRTPDEEAARRADGRRLYVGGLSYETTDDDLKQAFERFGTLVYCKVMTDKDTNRSRGFGFVTFTERSGADSALNYWDGNSLLGRAIRVVYARPKNDSMADKGPPAERYNDSRGFGSARDDYKGSEYRNDAPRGGGGYPREPRGGYDSRGEARPYSSAPVSTYAYPDERGAGGGRARDPYPASSTRDSADYAYAQDYSRDTRRVPDPYPPRAADYRAAPKDPYREIAYSTAPAPYPSYPASTRGAYSDARSSTGAYSNGGAAYPAPRRARSRSRSPPRGAAPASATSYNYPPSNSRTSYPPVADPYSSAGGRSSGGGYGDRRASYDPAYPATSSTRGGYSGAYYEEPPRARGRSAERSRGPPPSSGAYADSRGGYPRR